MQLNESTSVKTPRESNIVKNYFTRMEYCINVTLSVISV